VYVQWATLANQYLHLHYVQFHWLYTSRQSDLCGPALIDWKQWLDISQPLLALLLERFGLGLPRVVGPILADEHHAIVLEEQGRIDPLSTR